MGTTSRPQNPVEGRKHSAPTGTTEITKPGAYCAEKKPLFWGHCEGQKQSCFGGNIYLRGGRVRPKPAG